MSHLEHAIASQPVPSHRQSAPLEIGLSDMLIALATSALSLGVLTYGLSPIANWPILVLLHLAVLLVPAAFLGIRARRNGDLTIPVALLVATFAAGPVGALGCALLALTLRRQHPSPERLQDWYDYIAGVVARGRLTRIHEELVSGRLPSGPAAEVPRFRPILHGTSIEEQQDVLGVIGRRYHPDFRPVLRKALRNKNGFIRAQAAAVASRLDIEEKSRLWSTSPSGTGSKESADQNAPRRNDTLDVEAGRP